MNNKYQKLDALNQVADFHNTFKAPIVLHPAIPPRERATLRVALLQEELDELKKAIDDNNLVEAADALCDLQYVLSGAVLEFGLASKFPELFDEVQRSNMSKACQTEQEALDTIEEYRKKGIDTFFEYNEETDLYPVYRKADTKILKSINYSKADLLPIIKK